MAKQSRQDRVKRFEKGDCPVHGVCMTQVMYDERIKKAIVECCRGDCNIRAVAESSEGPWSLLPEYEALLS